MPNLTEPACKNATCPLELKRKRLSDGAGLYLEIAPNGSKRWIWQFYPEGKESRMKLGSHPDAGLKSARAARDEARKTRQTGVNPVQKRLAENIVSSTASASTFEAVAQSSTR